MFTDLQIPAGRRPLSQMEARISAIVGIVFTVMILASIFEEYSANRLGVILILIFWVPMLVLHELGHAIAAKLLGWRVREVVIGFGRDLWQWQFRETRIRIKFAPVEGYVLPQPTSAHKLRTKSMLIYAAGPGAELVLLAIMLLVLGPDYVFGGGDELGQVAAQSLAIAILLGAGFNLLPFSTDGGVSDGLGILSSPFLSDAAIELRLLAAEIRELCMLLDRGENPEALDAAKALLDKFPANPVLQDLYVRTLSANRADDEARQYVRDKLQIDGLDDTGRLMWLLRQARVELHAVEPSQLVLDLAVQKALQIAPNNLTAIATRAEALILRGQNETGGEILADVWRRNNGEVLDSELLAYLAIAAGRSGNDDACARFRSAFEQLNRSVRLRDLLTAQLGHSAEATSTAEK